MNFKEIIEEIYQKVKIVDDKGKLATYIPELANVDSENFGVHISTIDHINFGIGNYHQEFSIQSIAKVLSLTLVYQILGEKIWDRLGVKPSGTAFNSFVQLETDNGIPRNPFINAGAIVISDILLINLENPKEDLLAFVRSISNNSDLNCATKTAASEKAVVYRNVALCNFIKSFGNIQNEPSDVLNFYFDLCCLESQIE
jgi:glutaminase